MEFGGFPGAQKRGTWGTQRCAASGAAFIPAVTRRVE
jgi:hypothetical protein